MRGIAFAQGVGMALSGNISEAALRFLCDSEKQVEDIRWKQMTDEHDRKVKASIWH